VRRALVLALALALLAPAPAAADHGPTYKGHYANAFASGRAPDGRAVAVMAGVHTNFPYHHADSSYDQIAVFVEGSKPVLVTGRPKLDGLVVELGERTGRLAYAGMRVAFDLTFAAVRHTPRYYGDPADIGDLYLGSGVPRRDDEPGFVYTPYELTELERGSLAVGRSRVPLASLHGQAEAGEIEAPDDPHFRSAYDYLAAPTLDPGYTYMAFSTRALHSGLDGVLDPYFRETGSDEFTLAGGRIAEGNPNTAPPPFDNTAGLPDGARRLARWTTDLGPGILHRALVGLRDGSGRPLLALSETIKED
jgi:hypothetical protein